LERALLGMVVKELISHPRGFPVLEKRLQAVHLEDLLAVAHWAVRLQRLFLAKWQKLLRKRQLQLERVVWLKEGWLLPQRRRHALSRWTAFALQRRRLRTAVRSHVLAALRRALQEWHHRVRYTVHLRHVDRLRKLRNLHQICVEWLRTVKALALARKSATDCIASRKDLHSSKVIFQSWKRLSVIERRVCQLLHKEAATCVRYALATWSSWIARHKSWQLRQLLRRTARTRQTLTCIMSVWRYHVQLIQKDRLLRCQEDLHLQKQSMELWRRACLQHAWFQRAVLQRDLQRLEFAVLLLVAWRKYTQRRQGCVCNATSRCLALQVAVLQHALSSWRYSCKWSQDFRGFALRIEQRAYEAPFNAWWSTVALRMMQGHAVRASSLQQKTWRCWKAAVSRAQWLLARRKVSEHRALQHTCFAWNFALQRQRQVNEVANHLALRAASRIGEQLLLLWYVASRAACLEKFSKADRVYRCCLMRAVWFCWLFRIGCQQQYSQILQDRVVRLLHASWQAWYDAVVSRRLVQNALQAHLCETAKYNAQLILRAWHVVIRFELDALLEKTRGVRVHRILQHAWLSWLHAWVTLQQQCFDLMCKEKQRSLAQAWQGWQLSMLSVRRSTYKAQRMRARGYQHFAQCMLRMWHSAACVERPQKLLKASTMQRMRVLPDAWCTWLHVLNVERWCCDRALVRAERALQLGWTAWRNWLDMHRMEVETAERLFVCEVQSLLHCSLIRWHAFTWIALGERQEKWAEMQKNILLKMLWLWQRVMRSERKRTQMMWRFRRACDRSSLLAAAVATRTLVLVLDKWHRAAGVQVSLSELVEWK